MTDAAKPRPNDADDALMERLDSFEWVPDPTRPVAQPTTRNHLPATSAAQLSAHGANHARN